jgi:hypothetical protein
VGVCNQGLDETVSEGCVKYTTCEHATCTSFGQPTSLTMIITILPGPRIFPRRRLVMIVVPLRRRMAIEAQRGHWGRQSLSALSALTELAILGLSAMSSSVTSFPTQPDTPNLCTHSINYSMTIVLRTFLNRTLSKRRRPDFCTDNGPHLLPYTCLAGEAAVCLSYLEANSSNLLAVRTTVTFL